MREQEKSAVRGLRLFNSMRPDTFEEMLRGSFLQRFPAHVVLIHEGDPADFLHIVVDGGVELFSVWHDQESTMDIARPVSTFILAAVIKDAPYLMSARTIEASRILMIPSENLRRAMVEDEALGLSMVTELAACFRGVVKSLKNMKLRTGVERLANYLLHQYEIQNNGRVLVLPFEKRVLASLLGMTPENLSRAFNTLKPYGVMVRGAEIELTMLDDLRRLARPASLIDDPSS